MDSGAYGGPQNNGSRPVPLTSWERSTLGWLNYETVEYGQNLNNFKIYKSLGTDRNALKIQLEGDSDKNQYLFIEYLFKQTGTWTEYLPGSGLLVLRVDQNIVDYGTNGDPNAYNFNDFKDYHHGVEVVEADNEWELWNASLNSVAKFGEEEDLFRNVSDDILTPFTQPNTNYYKGSGKYNHTPTLYSGIYIDIKAKSDGVYFTVSVRKQ